MSLISRIFLKAEPERRAITYQLGTTNGLVEAPTRSGVSVSEQTALGISQLWAGIRIISADVGSLEPVLYLEGENGTRRVASDHPLSDLLTDTPNPEMTRPVFWETMMAHALLWGGMYAEIQRDGAGRPVALWPIHPRNVALMRDSSGSIFYRVTIAQSNLDPEHQAGQQVYLQQGDIFHAPGLSPDGLVGYRLLSVARETLGFGIACQRYGASFFGNAARPSGMLQTQGQLNETARENLRRSWQSLHSGTDNVGKVAILEEGLTFSPFQMTNEQNQYAAVLDWYGYQVAQMLCIPATKIGILGRATWSNLQELNQDYLSSCLRPWLEKIEAEAERKLLSPGERKSYYIEFDTTTLLRANIETRYSAYATALTNKFMTVNEVRARENLQPLDGGDTITATAPAPTAPVTAPETDKEADGEAITTD